MAYQPNIPTGSVPLNQDYLSIQNNFSTLNNLYSVDHIPLNNNVGTPPDGYHKAIHLVPQAPPTAVAGYGELYAQNLNDGISSGEQLWYQFISGSAVTINYPLTRNFQPLAASPGYTFLPGGFIMQWGNGASKATIMFNVAAAFTNVFSIQVTPTSFLIGSAPGVSLSGTTTFTSQNGTPGGNYNFYWVAIGN